MLVVISYCVVTIEAIKVFGGCDCQHRTAGDNCEKCQPLYNNVEYMRGTIDDASVCQSM